MNYDRWYSYHAVVEGIRHYDFVPADSHSKNRAWFFEPSPENPLGRLWTLPHDSDASWGLNWNSGIDYSKSAIFDDDVKVAYRREYRNTLREFRDLVWTREALEALTDDVAAPVLDFSQADRDRWREAPPTAGRQDFGPIEDKIADMKWFAFESWQGTGGPSVPEGGRALHLDTLSELEEEGRRLPHRPTVVATGPASFSLETLAFEVSAFEDLLGEESSVLKWRLGDVTSRSPVRLESPAVWALEETGAVRDVVIPRTVVAAGRTYRVRAKYRNAVGTWSHWSAPVEFTTAEAMMPSGVATNLRVTEFMYHPTRDGGFEFVEFQNIVRESLDLEAVALDGGIDFSFAGASPLPPGPFVVVVNNRAVFERAYDATSLRIAGEYRGRLSNGGDLVELTHGSELVLSFVYDDAWYPSTDGSGLAGCVAVEPGAGRLAREVGRPALGGATATR